MATTLQLRRGTAAEAAAFTGAVGELFIDVQNKLVYLHDGVTAGGVLVGGTGGGAAVVSGAVSGNTLTLTNSDASTVNINVTQLAQDANTYVTSATVSGSVITLHNNDGSTVNINLPSSVTGFLPSEVTEDMLPQFDAVYDLGSDAKRWYDVKASNSVSIGDTTLAASNGKLTANTEVVATSLTSADLVTDEALIGTVLHTGSTIMPEGTPGEYVDAKGTLTIDGNVAVADNLNVRNRINLLQTPVTAGTVIDTSYTAAVVSPIVIDNGWAFTNQLTSIYFTANGSQNTAYFNSQTEASRFYNDLVSNSSAVLTYSANGTQYTWTFQPYSVSYNPGGTQVYFYAGTINGSAPWDTGGSWNNWYFPWWSSGSYQIVSLAINSTVPAVYKVNIGGELPPLGLINKLYVNGSATKQVAVSYNTLLAFAQGVEPSYNGIDGMYFSSDASVGGEYLRFITTGNSMILLEALASSPTFTVTDAMSGLSWVIAPGQISYSMMLGGYYVMAFTVVSASNPQYPTPRYYNSNFSNGITRISYTRAQGYLQYLSSTTTSLVNGNVLSSSSDITGMFAEGDVLSYTTPTTSLVFGNSSGGLSKAITYNEVTGAITYDGIVSGVNIGNNDSLYSGNSSSPNNGASSVVLGGQAYASNSSSVALGYNAWATSNNTVAIGSSSRVSGDSGIAIGHCDSRGQYSTYIGYGGQGIGNMYNTTVIGMEGQSSSGWMWGSGKNVVMLGHAYAYVQSAGDYATVINGGQQSSSPSNNNLMGGSTWFAPQDRHAELKLSCYQYVYCSSATTWYPQLGYSSNTSVPYNFSTAQSTNRETAFYLKPTSNFIANGKIEVTVLARNLDVYGIYEINFVAVNNVAGTASIVSQTTTTVAQSGAPSYWNAPVLFLHASGYLQLSLTTLSAANNNYLSVHVGGSIRAGGAY